MDCGKATGPPVARRLAREMEIAVDMDWLRHDKSAPSCLTRLGP